MSYEKEEYRRKLLLIEILNDKLSNDRKYPKHLHVYFTREVLDAYLNTKLEKDFYLSGLSDEFKKYINEVLIEKYELEKKLIERFNLDEIFISEDNMYAIIPNKDYSCCYLDCDYYISKIKFNLDEDPFRQNLKLDLAKISKEDNFVIKPLIKDSPKDIFHTLKEKDITGINNLISKYRSVL